MPRLRRVQKHVDDHDGVDGATGTECARVPVRRRVAEVRRKLCAQLQRLSTAHKGSQQSQNLAALGMPTTLTTTTGHTEQRCCAVRAADGHAEIYTMYHGVNLKSTHQLLTKTLSQHGAY